MIRRFQIEDLISQDEFGVVFRALDSETGKYVAVRRFFPFGAVGGGLEPEEQNAYIIALDRLVGLNHPALRATICGGCDPVDGMPFIATEWVDGEPLQTFLEYGPLPADVTTDLITQALEVSELLSHVLAENAVWVETSPQTIIVGNEQSGRGFTFWICPLKWLGGHEKARSLESIADLTEIVMGWQDRKINDQAGQGLAGWLKWLRHSANTITLHEARETLAASVGMEPPPPTRKLVAQATLPPAARVAKPSSSKAAWIINITLALVAAGLGGWYLLRQREFEAMQMHPETAQALSDRPLGKAAAPAAANPRPAPSPRPTGQAKTPATTPAQDPGDLSHTVIPWTSRGLLSQCNGKQVIVEGPLEAIMFSESGATLYLLFSKELGKTDTRGSVIVKTAPADLSETSLTPLIGKQIRLHGTIHIQPVSGTVRPEIKIMDRASIEVIERSSGG